MTLNTPRRTRFDRPARRRTGRRGSVLIVVLALLSALMLLGFLFYTIASQERENARYFTASQKWYSAGLTPDELMDFALEQIIVGPQDDLANSALWGGRYSLLASLVGDDLQPYNGRGVDVVDSGAGVPFVAVEANNGGQRQLRLDVAEYAVALGSPSGPFHNLRDSLLAGAVGFAKPDAGYTYPDLNSPFLAYVGTEPMTGNRVIIPSFHRPQYLRGLFGGGASNTWYTDPTTAPYVMRPHSERPARVFDYETGEVVAAASGGTPIPRFEGGAGGSVYFSAPASDPKFGTAPDAAEGFWDRTAAADPIEHKYDADPDNDGVAEAVWMDLDHPVEETPDGTEKFIPLFAVTIYDLDGLLNVNGGGNAYGLPSDLASLPVNPFQFLSKSNEGRRRNEINPQYALLDGPAAMPTGPATMYEQHQRFFGAAPTTPTQLANMEWWFILAGRGELDASGTASQIYPGRYGEANLLSDALTNGSSNPYEYPRAGMTGSDEAAGVADGNRGSAYIDLNGQLFPPSMVFPAPRHPEDNQGQGITVLADGKRPLMVATPPALAALLGRVRLPIYQNYWLPVNAPAVGSVWAYALGANFPTVTRLVAAATAGTGLMWGDGRLVDDPGETMLDSEQARDQVTDSIFGADEAAALHMAQDDRTNNGIVSRLIKLAPANFEGADDNRERRRRVTTLSADLKAYAYPDPTGTPRAWEVEPVDANNPNVPTFPPRVFGLTNGQFDSREPFRFEARGLLASLPNLTSAPPNTQTVLKQLTRKLSVNHVASAYVSQNDGQPRFLLRPVTPHPTGLAADAIPVPAIRDAQGNLLTPGAGRAFFGVEDRLVSASGFATTAIATPPGGMTAPQLQEWHARRDRQNLARDIYTLLYTFGDVTGVNVKTTNPYTTAQLVEMAQFAVNVVDAMDPDDTITCFVFDLDLSSAGNGYTPLDDGYSNPVTTLEDRDDAVDEDGVGDADDDLYHYIDAANGRGMVYGVESQQVAFSEAMALFAAKFEDASGDGKDHKATDWNDEQHRDFTFVELQNMTATPVRLSGGWSIVAKVTTADPMAMVSTVQEPRAVTLNIPFNPSDPTTYIAPGAGVFTVGSAGDAHNTERSPNPAAPRSTWSAATPTPSRRSHFSVDLQGSEDADPAAFADYERIAPVMPALTFDLMERENAATTRQTFRVNSVDPNDVTRDGSAFGSVNDDEIPTASGTAPKAGGWLNLGPLTSRDGLSGNVTFYLRRRLNLNRTTPAETYPAVDYTAAPLPPTTTVESDNPWVVVDTMEVVLDTFDLNSAPDIATAVTSVVSDQRVEPLANLPTPSLDYGPTAAYEDYNNLGVQSPGGAMQLWQRHFDRPFASTADLLSVPLYGPGELTEANAAVNISVTVRDPRQTAAANILFPEAIVGGTPTPNPRPVIVPGSVPGALAPAFPAGNLWYRLLEFVEVPQKHGDNDSLPWFAHYGGPSPWLSDAGRREPWLRERLRHREFGKLNLNTMRHPHALAGLLDDPRVMTFQNARPLNGTPPGAGYLPSSAANQDKWLATSGPALFRFRDWWLATVASRDGGNDPYSFQYFSQQRVILPGVPSAKPFLDFGRGPTGAAPPGTDFQRTLLRTISKDTDGAVPYNPEIQEDTAGRRSLFEIGNVGSVPPLLGSDADFSTRYRLLGKVLNHGTTRSNTYVAFVQVDFFDATPAAGTTDGDHDNSDATPAVYQIGAKRPDSPEYRGVFVIDRSLALELLRRRDLPPNDQGLQYPQSSKYRTFSFAREPGPDQRPQPTFEWRDLVQYRRIVAQ